MSRASSFLVPNKNILILIFFIDIVFEIRSLYYLNTPILRIWISIFTFAIVRVCIWMKISRITHNNVFIYDEKKTPLQLTFSTIGLVHCVQVDLGMPCVVLLPKSVKGVYSKNAYEASVRPCHRIVIILHNSIK